MTRKHHNKITVMAGLDPATQWPRVCAAEKPIEHSKRTDSLSESPARADVRALGGRVKPGHDELKGRDAGPAIRINAAFAARAT